MKKKRRSLSHLLALLVCMWYIPALYAVTWVGPVVTNVTDEDLILDASGGTIELPVSGTTISALTADVNVTLINGNVSVEGNVAGESQLYLTVAACHTITFDMTSGLDLTFLGSPFVGSTPGAPLLIVMSGEGTVVFLLSGGRTLTFTSDSTHGPVQFYEYMADRDEYTSPPAIVFSRCDSVHTQDADNITIEIGPQSLISYLSSSLTLDDRSKGFIIFNPTNCGTGQMILDIADTGAYIIAGAYTSATTPDLITLSTIDRTQAAGRNAITRLDLACTCPDEYGDPTSALLVINRNATCFELLVDPFTDLGAAQDLVNFKGAFDGIRYGFVLGANGTLEVADNSYIDYVGLASNQCPCTGDIAVMTGPCCPPDCSDVRAKDCCCGSDEWATTPTITKCRNYSAFIVDGNLNPASIPARILLGNQSGIYFRSGVNCQGLVNDDLADPFVFTVDPATLTRGAGDIVFDVEGTLNVFGSDEPFQFNSRLEILSLHVFPFGGPLFPGIGNQVIFPIRSGAETTSGILRRYNKAAMLVNNCMNLHATSLAHTDENHLVFQANDTDSEPTYIGGEHFFIRALQGHHRSPRPKISFIDSRFLINTDVALTGLDLLVPNNVFDGFPVPNVSNFIFYGNGYAVDNGTGREMILGTLIGAEACDCCSLVNRDVYLDVMHDRHCFRAPTDRALPLVPQDLFLTVSENSSQLIKAIGDTDITGQRSIHNIYLGWASNISIGTDVEPPLSDPGFPFNTQPALLIAGNFFSFATRGGLIAQPDTSNVTGQGGIFVDTNGFFGILPDFIASIGTMVTKSGNGIVSLPPQQVVFASKVGVADWQLNLNFQQPETVIVGPDQIYSDYTLNWISTIKDFTTYTPYMICDVNVTMCPPVLPENIVSLPAIQGTIDQLQIEDSRIGDPVNVVIDGGYVREILWLSSCRPAEAATALIVLQNNGRIGINTAHRNRDSIYTETTLGVNGMSFIANGSGRIDLNEDVIIDNICPFLMGPDFTSDDTLEIFSELQHTIRVMQGGTLDLRSFTVPGTIRFSGEVVLLMEPGSTLILGSAVVTFTENAQLRFDDTLKSSELFTNLDATLGAIDNSVNPTDSVLATNPRNDFSPIIGYGNGVQNTDPFRIRIVGTGSIVMADQSQAILEPQAYVGVETLYRILPGDFGDTIFEIPTTNFTLELTDGGQFIMGEGNTREGGSFQVGNTVSHAGHSITFTLLMNGEGARFVAGAGSFFGLGAGVVRGDQSNMTATFADVLFNTAQVNFDFGSGTMTFDRIFDSDETQSQAFVIGDVGAFDVNYLTDTPETPIRNRNFDMLGGSNLYLILPPQSFNSGAMALVDRLQDGVIQAPVTTNPPTTVTVTRMETGILASTALMDNITVGGLTPTELFDTFKVVEGTAAITRDLGLADAAPFDVARFRGTFGILGYVDRGLIGRFNFTDVTDINANGPGGTPEDRRLAAFDIGAVAVQVDTLTEPAPGEPFFAVQLQ